MSDLRPPFPGDDRDPRIPPSDAATPLDSSGHLRPAVAAATARGGTGWIVGGAAFLGLLAFVVMSAQRHPSDQAAPRDDAPAAGILPPPPPPPDLMATETAARAATPAIALVSPPPAAPPVNPFPAMAANPPPSPAGADPTAAARKSPALVVDLEQAPAPAAASGQAQGATAVKSAGSTGGGAAETAGLNADEKFAERVGAAEPERSRATLLRNTRETIAQGAMIPGVLETALNSDLPGFARAVVSRDVRGFDGSTVLVPRGSRVIGQYKSAVALGQSRAFVIWTRIIRPDGASIQIGSSGTDPLGRAGLDGTVDRHFFERYGGAALLTVINLGMASLARAPSTQVVIGSSTEATNLGAAASPTTISPTIKVPQGSPIRIFVARDLDFAPVGGVK